MHQSTNLRLKELLARRACRQTGKSVMESKGQFPKHRFVFLTLPNYSMIALSSAVEALRMANRVTKQDVYEWSLASLDGNPVAASNGLAPPTQPPPRWPAPLPGQS